MEKVSDMVEPKIQTKDICVSKNDILAFDYNKEIHYISLKENSLQNSSKRTVLKLHYVVYPIGFDIFAIILSYCCEYYNTLNIKIVPYDLRYSLQYVKELGSTTLSSYKDD